MRRREKRRSERRYGKREMNTRETHKAKSVSVRESRIWGKC